MFLNQKAQKNHPKVAFASIIAGREGIKLRLIPVKQFSRQTQEVQCVSSPSYSVEAVNVTFLDRDVDVNGMPREWPYANRQPAPQSVVNSTQFGNRSPAREGTKRSLDTEPQSSKRTPAIQNEKLTRTDVRSFLSEVFSRTGNLRSKSSSPDQPLGAF